MTAPQVCSTCDTPLPEGAAFCPACGTATPPEIDQATGEVSKVEKLQVEEAEYRQRLQRALGDAYELRDVIGRGGFGVVYAAWDVRLKRDLAVKALRSDVFPTPALLERFQREAQAVAQLRHPNIVPIYAVGEGEGLAYMIMPRIDGENLRALLQRESQLPIDEVRRILTEAAAALEAAHQTGVVHRDIKPENFMLEGSARRVLLMDFGIAKPLGVGESGLTGTGMIIGTPEYMSPEQASGERHIDHRSDQYSLAVVGYQMLTGELPFVADSIARMIYKQISEDPPPLSEKREDIPQAISDAHQRALAKSRADRFSTVKAFAAALSASEAVAAPSEPSAPAAPAIEREPQAIPASEAPAVSRPLIGFGVLGLAVFLALYGRAFPPPLAAPTVTRSDAIAAARAFFADHGAVGSFEEAIVYHGESTKRLYLQRTLGATRALQLVQDGMPVGHWHFRWFQPQQREEWSVAIDRSGEVVQFRHVLEETAAGEQLSQEAALLVATPFLTARGWNLDDLERVRASSEQRPNRTDYHFTWEKSGSIVAAAEEPDAGVGTVRVSVDVQGDAVGGYRHELRVPEEFERSQENATMVGVVLIAVAIFVLALVAFVIAMVRQRAKEVRWGLALRLGGFVAALLLLSMLNELRGLGYTYTTETGWSAWVALMVLGLLVALVGAFGLVLLGAAAGESLGRQVLPKSLAGYVDALRGRLISAGMGRIAVSGCLLGAALLGYAALFNAVARMIPGVWYVSEGGYVNMLDEFLPFLVPVTESLAGAVLQAVIVLFLIVFLKRFLKSTGLALAVGALLWGAVACRVFPFYVGAVGSAVGFLILGLGFVHVGLLACIVALYVRAAVTLGMSTVTSGYSEGMIVSGVVVLILALLPLLPAAMARSRPQLAPSAS